MADDHNIVASLAVAGVKRPIEEECDLGETKRKKSLDTQYVDELDKNENLILRPYNNDNINNHENPTKSSSSCEDHKYIRYKFWKDKGFGEERAQAWSEHPFEDFLAIYHKLVAAGKLEPFLGDTSVFKESNEDASAEPETLTKSANENNLTLIIYRADSVPVSKKFAAAIKKMLSNLIGMAIRKNIEGEKLAFDKSGLVTVDSQKVFLVTALTIEARDWLLSQDFGDYGGAPVKIAQFKRAQVSIWIPGNKEDRLEDPMMFIKGQNNYKKELRVKEWNLISRDIKPDGEHLVVGIPQQVAEACGVSIGLNFEATQVYGSVMMD